MPTTVLALLFAGLFFFQRNVPVSADIRAPQAHKLPVITQSIVSTQTNHFQRPIPGPNSQNYWWGHRAIDIPNPVGTPIRPVAAGEVVAAGWDGDYGNAITIRHLDGFTSHYAHLSKIFVTVGEKVTATTVIGAVGATGRATGSHLHLELILDGLLIDPENFLPQNYIP